MATRKIHPAPNPTYANAGGQPLPPGNAKERTFLPNGIDGFTGPSYGERRGNTPVQGTSKNVKRFGVMAASRGEWKR